MRMLFYFILAVRFIRIISCPIDNNQIDNETREQKFY